ncbi:MAG: gamma-glutamyl-gamma-aminobutyrate hydrolase family protein [Pirellulales bacterium]|nr:gamma-glutamyl-gamma-aminobutyrate hydrolase family protein [Pirellulales bacterium]
MKRQREKRTRAARGRLAVLLMALAAAACTAPSAEPPVAARSGARPLIGITSTVRKRSVTVPLAYARAVYEAGGAPVIVPAVDDDALRAEFVRRLDGLVLTGGGDVPPSAYGEEPHATVKLMTEARWNFEPKLIDQWLDSGKPLLGVCLGAQMVNVVQGGSLVQDVPGEVGRSVVHAHPPDKKDSEKKKTRAESDGKKKAVEKEPITHRVTLAADSRLREILGVDQLTVVSSHHQAARRLGRGIRAAAHSDDGVIEALEIPDHRWAVFVQWHPEQMDRAHRQALFGSLVRACGSAHTGKMPVAR